MWLPLGLIVSVFLGIGPHYSLLYSISVSIWLSSNLSIVSDICLAYMYIELCYILCLPISALTWLMDNFIHFISLCDSCMIGNDIIFRKVQLFHRYPVFFQMSMFTAQLLKVLISSVFAQFQCLHLYFSMQMLWCQKKIKWPGSTVFGIENLSVK